MIIEDQNGVDRVDRKAQWPHFLNKETRLCFVAQRVTNMRWGRRCWDCPERLLKPVICLFFAGHELMPGHDGYHHDDGGRLVALVPRAS